MITTEEITEYREEDRLPDIRLAGLEIWVHGRQFPYTEDYWDGNWINITAHCGASGVNVWIDGNIIHLPEIAHLLAGAEALYKNIETMAELSCMEPQLSFVLESTGLDHINATVRITPDHLAQKHEFFFEIDYSYLPKLIRECKGVLERYPVKGKP
jgi:hypothetical protein